jgi:hypothetical protein
MWPVWEICVQPKAVALQDSLVTYAQRFQNENLSHFKQLQFSSPQRIPL